MPGVTTPKTKGPRNFGLNKGLAPQWRDKGVKSPLRTYAPKPPTDLTRFGANGTAGRAAVAVGEGGPARPKTRHARDWASTRSCAPFPRPEG